MKSRILSVIALLCIFAVGARAEQPTRLETSMDPRITVPANNNFGYNLIREVVKTERNKNVFLSPISAAMALSLLLNGARANTYTAIAQTLQVYPWSLDMINYSNRLILQTIQEAPAPNPQAGSGEQATPFTLTLANSIWSAEKAEFRYAPAYVESMRNFYNAGVFAADFETEAGVNAINGWASQNTNGRINNIIDLDTLKDLWFVLMNATYFKANWQNQFSAWRTSANVDFHLADGRMSKVQMMNDTGYYKYFANADAEVIELPYEGERASMYVALPRAGRPLQQLAERADGIFSAEFWANVRSAFLREDSTKRGSLALPKFGFAYSAKLNDQLGALGMDLAFTNDANFSAIGEPATKVSLVKQDTFIKLDEKGTEAAAVTLIGGIEATSVPPPAQFNMVVNRPFAIAIVENTTGSVLFLGTVAQPEWRD